MAGRNKSAKEKIEEWNQFVNDAANVGIDEIIKQHPVFSDNRNYIIRHIDKRKLMTTAREINYELSFKKWDERKKSEYLHAAIASAVSTGTLFDDEGKEIILKKSLEEKAGRGFFRGLFARRTLEGENILTRA